MKTLIVEDDFVSRTMLQQYLKNLGPSHVALNGEEAVEAVKKSLEENSPYDLISLDIMMPKMDGQEALVKIRELESQHNKPLGLGAKIIMTTALKDKTNIMTAFRESCDGYLTKPIKHDKLFEQLTQLELIDEDSID